MMSKSGNVLNPALYHRLKSVFGSVKISRSGEAARFRQQGVAFSLEDSGEYYRVNCPFCYQVSSPDRNYHLWIHHRWGVGIGLDQMFWAAICYRNDCLRRGDNLEQLKDMIGVHMLRVMAAPAVTFEDPGLDDEIPGEIPLPGVCEALEDHYDDEFVQKYFADHGFGLEDVAKIILTYRVQYCVVSETPVLCNSIYIPFFFQGRLIGWQCKGPRFKGYYTCPSMKVSRVVYGFDLAVRHNFAVIVEGVSDAWKVGPPAVAICGGQVSRHQASLLAEYFDRVILMLDGDALPERRLRSRRFLLAEGLTVEEIILPDDTDPGELPRDYLWERIQEALSRMDDVSQLRKKALWLPA